MNVLVIASDLGYTAPGIVYETILKELSKAFNLSVISIKTRNQKYIPAKYLPTAGLKYEHYRVSDASMSFFGRNLYDYYWLLKQRRLIKKEIVSDHDVIITLMSNHNYKSLILGCYLSYKYKKKWVIYSVDAVPAPLGWSTEGKLFRNTKKFISRYIPKCDAFFSSNKQMLDYQLGFLEKRPYYTGYIYTPIHTRDYTEKKIGIERCQLHPVFLYTGGVYGPRRIENLLEGFRFFLKDYPLAKLVFVGTPKLHQFDSYEDLILSKNIEINGYTQDLAPYYDIATALIDLNAFFDNDIFLSSKIVNYLPLRKPIISITGLNSPSRNIFSADESIIHCIHDSGEIYRGLLNSVIQTFDYKQRDIYIEKFMPQNAVKPLLQVLGKISY